MTTESGGPRPPKKRRRRLRRPWEDPQTLPEWVASRLRAKRKEMGITTQEMADAMGIRRNNYERMERCLIKIHFDRIPLLATLIGCHYLSLIEGWEPPAKRKEEDGSPIPINDPVRMGSDPRACPPSKEDQPSSGSGGSGISVWEPW